MFLAVLTTHKTLDLSQVDHGGRRARGRERATRATKSRVVDLCRLQEFKSHYILARIFLTY